VKGKYKKASFCMIGGCVEIKNNPGGGASIRSSKKKRNVLRLSPKEWRDFLRAVKRGEFN